MRQAISPRLAQNLFFALDPASKRCVYTAIQLARDFKKPIYKSPPWFLKFKERKFPSDKELQHNLMQKCENKSILLPKQIKS